MDQKEIFLASEGDNWFRRNRAALEQFDPETDLVLRLLALYSIRPARAVEIGAANGVRLARLRELYGSEVVAVEPSEAAIEDGRARYPEVRFARGAADATGLEESFDVAIVHGVFCWVDRRGLLPSLAEVDRLLQDGGYLLIGDFCPANRLRVRYHHLEDQDVHTYKQDYSSALVESGLYHRVALLTTSHARRTLDPEAGEGERFGVSLLRKSVAGHYVDRPLDAS